MGLDMYVRVQPRKPETPVDFTADSDWDRELYYWRKHPNLHGWMEKLYHAKGGKMPEFNTTTLELTDTDLNKLEADILASTLPETVGFFFGRSSGEEAKDDLEFIKLAREELAKGNHIYYSCWW